MSIIENCRLQEASGSVSSDDKLVSFLYELLRDHLSAGDVQKLLVNSTAKGTTTYTNGFLASYAMYVAKRLRYGELHEPEPIHPVTD